MKKIVFIALFWMPVVILAQKSYEFSQPLPPDGHSTFSTDSKHFGVYKSKQSDIEFEISENGIFAITTIVNSVSLDSILLSSNYHVKNNYLFGIKGIDSIAVLLQDNRYYFGIIHKEEIVGSNSKNVLVQISNQSYMLNFYEANAYQPCIFTVAEGNLSIRYFDYDSDTQIFSKMPKQKEVKESNLYTVTLAPQKQDFENINYSEMFGSAIMYKKVNGQSL